MAPPIPIPPDVRQWLTGTFKSCNERVAAKVTRIPTGHETSLDLTFIEHFSGFSLPFQFPSGWVVEINTHYLGGARHFAGWEIADIGLLVQFRQSGRLVRSKIALLQSKRLYPDEQEWSEDTPTDYEIGFARLFQGDDEWASITKPRLFSFTDVSSYKALIVADHQYAAIAGYESQFDIPVYYLLYHPWRIPSSTVVPVAGVVPLDGPCEVGCRVLPAQHMRAAMNGRPDGHKPGYAELRLLLAEPFTADENQAGWRLEHFVVDLLLECETGHIAASPQDPGLERIFYRRGAPIAAAIAITIDAP